MTDGRDSRSPEEVDDATAISTRRGAPDEELDEATAISARRAEPADDATRLSFRREWPVDDATALSARRGGPGGSSTVGPRRSPAPEPDGVTQSATTSPAEPEVVEDTILRPLRPAAPSPDAAEPTFEAAQPHRTAYVPSAGDFGERRAPRAPEAAVVTRAQAPSPRSLDRDEAGGSASGPRRARRLRPGIRLLILAGAIVVVAVLAAAGLALLLT